MTGMVVQHVCDICGRKYMMDGEYDKDCPNECPSCVLKYSPALRKACVDEFLYAVGLTDGTVITFSKATVYGDWVHLYDVDDDLDVDTSRGIDVNLNHILWVVEAPKGS